MKYAIWALLILCVCAACTKSDRTPVEEDFAVTLKQAVDGVMKSGEDIEWIAELTNLSDHSVKILHASPLIHVQIYDEQDQPQIDMFVTNDIGLYHVLEPNESYNPDSQTFNGGKRLIKVEKPGRYKLVGTASFSIESDNKERKDYKIVSEPVWVTVEEGMRTLATTDGGRFRLRADPYIGAGEDTLKLGQIDLSYGFTKEGVTVDLGGGFQMESEVEGEIPLYAIKADGGRYLPLWEKTDVDAKALLGKPLKESTRQLGPEADTFNGTYLKTMTYRGLELTLASGDGEKYSLINMRVTDRRYPTSLGIRVGDTAEQVEAAYPSIEIAKDGRSPPRDYAYSLGDSFPFGLIIDIKDGIVNEIYLEYLMD